MLHHLIGWKISFWLLVFFVTFWPMLTTGGWSMGICLYVWNPWQTSGQVCYPYIKICQKNSSSTWCTTPEKQVTTSTKQDSYTKCSTKLNAVARSCSIRKLINFLIIVPELWLMHYVFFLNNSFKGKKCSALIKSSTFTSNV